MVLAGAKARASDIKPVNAKSKAATETVTASTTFQDDDDLFIELEAEKSYRVQLFLTVSSGGDEAADIKVTYTFDGTATKSSRTILGPALGATSAIDTTVRLSATGLTSSAAYGIDAGLAVAIIEDLLLEDLTVAGTLQMQWAQSTSNATGTTLSNTSRIYWQEVDVA
jgi:hypothetical protein